MFYLCLMVVARLVDKEMTGSPQDRRTLCALSLMGFSAGCVDSHQDVWYMWGLLGSVPALTLVSELVGKRGPTTCLAVLDSSAAPSTTGPAQALGPILPFSFLYL